MLKEQVELFQKMEFTKVDMSMKTLNGKVNKQIIFECQYFLHGKVSLFSQL